MNQALLKIIFGFILMSLLTTESKAGVLLQGFYWDASPAGQHGEDSQWWDEISRNADSLASVGFSAIWLPPALKGASGGYSNGYDPFDDYDLGSKDQRGTVATRWGTRDHLLRSVAILRAAGFDVYEDMVLAHRGGDDGNKNFLYKNAFNQIPGGRFQKSTFDFTFENSPFGRNLDSAKTYVRKGLVQSGDWLSKALGLQGMRIDYAKGLSADFLKYYLSSESMAQQLAITEYWDENVDVLSHFVHDDMQSRVKTFDFPLWGKLKDMGNSNGYFDMRKLVQAGLAGRDPMSAVTFVENHDTDQNFPTHSGKELGYAYILTSEGYPSVFWKDYFNYGLKPVIDNLVWIHEALASGGTTNRWADDDLLVFERLGGQHLLIGMNDNQNSSRSEHIQTGFGSHRQLHDYSGHAADQWTDDQGQVQIQVSARSFVAYAPAGIQVNLSRVSHFAEQEIAGADDLDIGPAVQEHFSTAGRIWVKAHTNLSWNLFFDVTAWPSQSQLQFQVTDPQGKIILQKGYGQSQQPGSGQIQVSSDGWYKLELRAFKTPDSHKNINYWLKLKYQAPTKL